MKFRRVSEEKIKSAMKEGQFDNLRGKGKPIEWPEDDSPPSEDWMAHHVLKNAGLVPIWIEIDKKLRDLLDSWEDRAGEGLSISQQEKFEETAIALLEKLKQEAPEQISQALWARMQKIKGKTGT